MHKPIQAFVATAVAAAVAAALVVLNPSARAEGVTGSAVVAGPVVSG